MKQKMTHILRGAVVTLALALVMAGCSNPASPARQGGAGPAGTVTLTIGSGARTVSPLVSQFGKIALSFAGQGGTADLEDVPVAGGSATVSLPPGSWSVTAKAYINATDSAPAAASAARIIGWNGSALSGDTTTAFILGSVGTGNGTLKYTVTVPGGLPLDAAESRIQIKQGGTVLVNAAITATTPETGLALAAGRYAVDIKLVKDGGDTAAYRETAVILSGLTTNIVFAPAAGDFLDPAAFAALADTTGLDFGVTGDNSSASEIDFDDGALPLKLTVTAPAGTEQVFFTMTKGAALAVATGGADAASVTQGDADNETATDTLAVFTVDGPAVTDDPDTLSWDKHFTLTLTGAEGAESVRVEVTVSVGGLGLFKLNSGVWQAVAYAGEGIDDLLAYFSTDDPAKNNTEYLVTINSDQKIGWWRSPLTGAEGVKITLRGTGLTGGENRRIRWNGSLVGFGTTQVGLLMVNPGTTLILDRGITLDGNYRGMVGRATGSAMVYVNSPSGNTNLAEFSMRDGSKIINAVNTSANNGTTAGSAVHVNGAANSVDYGRFTMEGGEISGNTSSVAVVNLYYGSFTMDGDNAIITGNVLWSNPVSPDSTGAAVLLGSYSKFTLKEGTISNNLMGVRAGSYSSFSMEGGSIIDNGTEGIRGAGIFMQTNASVAIKGGVISGNGTSGVPGSAILSYGKPNTLSLEGPVTISGSIALAKPDLNIQLGSNFSNTAGPITINLATSLTNTPEAFVADWISNLVVLKGTDTDPATITQDFIDGNFTIGKYYTNVGLTPSPPELTGIPDRYLTEVSGEGVIGIQP